MIKVTLKNGFWKTTVKGAVVNVIGQNMGYALGMIGTKGTLEAFVPPVHDLKGKTLCQFIAEDGKKWVIVVGKMKQVGVHSALRTACKLPDSVEGTFVRYVKFTEEV